MYFVSSDADVIDYARTGQGTDKMSAVEGGATTSFTANNTGSCSY